MLFKRVLPALLLFPLGARAQAPGWAIFSELDKREAGKVEKIEDVAKSLGYSSVERFRAEAVVFADRISKGFLPSDWDKSCAEKYQSSLCEGLKAYFQKRLEGDPKPVRAKPIKYQVKDVADLQKENFDRLISRWGDFPNKDFDRYAKAALETSDCPRSLSIFLARVAEREGTVAGREKMKRLDTHGLECLSESDPYEETFNLRLALFLYHEGKAAEAVPLLEKARRNKAPRELYRTLFWLGRVAEKAGDLEKSKKAYEELHKRYPLSWHSLLRRTEEKVDPLSVMAQKNPFVPQPGSDEDFLNRQMGWLKALILTEQARFPVQYLGETILKSMAGRPLEPGFLWHMARLTGEGGYHKIQSSLLNDLRTRYPEMLSAEHLTLMYPRPYADLIDKYGGTMDRAVYLGLVKQESSFDPYAQSGVDARGLFQVLPSTSWSFAKVRGKDLFDETKNVKVGTKYLASLHRNFGNTVEKALGAYNAGFGNMRKWERLYGDIKDPLLFADLIPFRETRDYISSIMRNAYWYHRLYPDYTRQLFQKDWHTSEYLRSMLKMQMEASKTPADAKSSGS